MLLILRSSSPPSLECRVPQEDGSAPLSSWPLCMGWGERLSGGRVFSAFQRASPLLERGWCYHRWKDLAPSSQVETHPGDTTQLCQVRKDLSDCEVSLQSWVMCPQMSAHPDEYKAAISVPSSPLKVDQEEKSRAA